MASEIKLGNATFSASALRGVSLKEAQAKNAHIDPRLVKNAWEKANPAKVKK